MEKPMSESLKKLTALLAELFQLDQAELDFGIYRIMNAKREEITRFLENDLLPQVREFLSVYESESRSALRAELENAKEQAKALGFEDPAQAPKVKELEARYNAAAFDVEAAEKEVFSHLYNFFRRYYSEGDFISLRRYKEGVYAIPYEGEEVKLYWANHDQYYIKTSEYLRNYTFKLPSGQRVHFKLVDADTEKDNNSPANGKERRFILSGEQPLAEEKGELVIRFEYRPAPGKRKQADLNAEAVERIRSTIEGSPVLQAVWSPLVEKRPTEKNPNRTLLEKHLTDYTARNTFDYFIHKDLGGFLRRELDFYIKNEVMHLDDIESGSAPRVEQYLLKIKAIRRIAHKIIDFLAQIENFQKKLWLKKKFVVETQYCVTLDRVPEALYPDIVASDSQREEWVRLFAIDEIQGDLTTPGYSTPLTVEFLKANPYLVLDTRHFSDDFKRRLLASFDDLDEQCDGLLIHSENYQALSLLGERYRQQVCCAYNDPPYNTEADRNSGKFLYRDGYERSSWMSLLYDRILQTLPLLGDDAPFLVSIDEHEFGRLNELLGQLLGTRIGVFTWVKKAKGSHLSQTIRDMTEFVLAYCRAKDGLMLYGEPAYSEKAQPLAKKTNARKILKFPPNTVRTTLDDGTYDAGERGKGDSALTFTEPFSVVDGVVTTGIVVEGPFIWSQAKLDEELALGTIPLLSRQFGLNVMRHDQAKKFKRPSTLLSSEQGIGTNETAFQEYVNLFGVEPRGLYPKPVSLIAYLIRARTFFSKSGLILDAFAGSGSTAHAVINLNREDGGRRKYILIEMGDYFDTVLVPRIKKVVYSKDWKGGKPVSREGISHMFKVLRLESYEDTLNNLELKRTEAQQSLLERHPDFREDYMLRYMLDVESRGSVSLLNLDRFDDPFSYKLDIAMGTVGETKPAVVDLVETFNYLIGLRVKTIGHIGGVHVVTGLSPRGERVLILWRNTKETDNDKLDDWFKRQGYDSKDQEYDVIYVNGDNNLENLKKPDQTWKVRLTEEEFLRRMLDVQDV
jgi:adenine-specific DNA-methyltransferase